MIDIVFSTAPWVFGAAAVISVVGFWLSTTRADRLADKVEALEATIANHDAVGLDKRRPVCLDKQKT